MNFVALLSGGKDSCFNLLHCQANGHRLVAAASLRPPEGVDELDSFLYQSVGQEAVQLVADALQIPLYRGTIKGSAVIQSLQYGSNDSDNVEGDETEDLFELLGRVKQAHPEIQAVAVGAILSNYQRLRVEHVCNRLSLVPLCYLWQRSQRELFSEMIDSGMDAIVIKVAGIGLSNKHIGKSLSEIKSYLFKLNELYGSHICGEGGEYETLTLDCPIFHQKISIQGSDVVTHSDSAFASVYYLRITDASLVPKIDASEQPAIRPPALLCPDAMLISNTPISGQLAAPIEIAQKWDGSRDEVFSLTVTEHWLSISNLSLTGEKVVDSAAEELEQLFTIVEGGLLKQHGLKFEHVISVNLFLASMATFPSINSIYNKRFRVSPPARVCVEAILPHGRHVRMELIAYIPGAMTRKYSLHVQSLSYWAPANIGPYSQAVAVGPQIFVSGQIGLVPANNTLPTPSSLPVEAALALQHLHRIKEVVQDEFRTVEPPHYQSLLVWTADFQNCMHLLDIWRKHQFREHAFHCFNAPVAFLVAPALPKNALCEMQATLHSPVIDIVDPEDPELSIKSAVPEQLLTQSNTNAKFFGETAKYQETGSSCGFLFFDQSDATLTNPEITGHGTTVRLYCSASPDKGIGRLGGGSEQSISITFVGVTGIVDRTGRNWDYLAVLNTLPTVM